MYLPAALHGIGWLPIACASFVPLSTGWYGLVVSLWLVFVQASGCWMGLLGVPAFCVVWFRFRLFRRYLALWSSQVGRAHRLLKMLVRGVLGMDLFTYSLPVLPRLGFGGILSGWVRLDLGCLCFVICLALCSISRLPFLMLGAIRLQLIFGSREGFRGGPLLDIFGSLQLLNSTHVRERNKAVLRSVMVGGVWKVMVAFWVNVPFLLLLRFVKILSFMIS